MTAIQKALKTARAKGPSGAAARQRAANKAKMKRNPFVEAAKARPKPEPAVTGIEAVTPVQAAPGAPASHVDTRNRRTKLHRFGWKVTIPDLVRRDGEPSRRHVVIAMFDNEVDANDYKVLVSGRRNILAEHVLVRR